MSCILTVTGTIGEIVEQKNSVLFSVQSFGPAFGSVQTEKGRQFGSEWTAFVAEDVNADRLKKQFSPGCYVYVMAKKVTEKHTDENGNEVSETLFRVLKSNDALFRINSPRPNNNKKKQDRPPFIMNSPPCILTVVGRVDSIVDMPPLEDGRNVIQFTIESRGGMYGFDSTTKRTNSEWTTLTAAGGVAERFKTLIEPNDFVFVVARKKTTIEKDENGDEYPLTSFQLLGTGDSIYRVHRPWVKNAKRLTKDMDTQNAFAFFK